MNERDVFRAVPRLFIEEISELSEIETEWIGVKIYLVAVVTKGEFPHLN